MASRDADDVLAALDHLIANGKLQESPSGVALADSAAQVSAEDRAAIDELRGVYESYGSAPLPRDEIAPELRVRLTEARRLVKLATDLGELVHISGAYFVASSVADDMHVRVRELLAERGSITVGDVRQLLGISRKHAVPICEYLDRVRVTRRVGNERVLFDEQGVAGGA